LLKMRVHLPQTGQDVLSLCIENSCAFWNLDGRSRTNSFYSPIFNDNHGIADWSFARSVNQICIRDNKRTFVLRTGAIRNFGESSHSIVCGFTDENRQGGFITLPQRFKMIELGVDADKGD